MPTRKLLWIWSNVTYTFAIYHSDNKIIVDFHTLSLTLIWFKTETNLKRFELPAEMFDLENLNLDSIAKVAIATDEEFKKMD